MKILFTTTVDLSFKNSHLLNAWLAWIFYAILRGTESDLIFGATNKISPIDISIAIGCMVSGNQSSESAQSNFELLDGALNCTYLPNVPGLNSQQYHKGTKTSYKVTSPNVRRMLMLSAFARTGEYDMIVYNDLDAIFLQSPLSELIDNSLKNFSASFSRDEYNISRVCNGFFAIYDMRLPQNWAKQGVYSQTEINSWIEEQLKRVHNRSLSSGEFFTELDLGHPFTGFIDSPSTEVKSSDSVIKLKEQLSKVTTIKLLPEPEYFRGHCMSPITSKTKVYHCHSTYFRSSIKEKELMKAGRLAKLDNEFILKLINSLYVFNSSITPDQTVKYSEEKYKRHNHIGFYNETSASLSTYSITLQSHFVFSGLAGNNISNAGMTDVFNNSAQWRRLYGSFYYQKSQIIQESLNGTNRQDSFRNSTITQIKGNYNVRKTMLLHKRGSFNATYIKKTPISFTRNNSSAQFNAKHNLKKAMILYKDGLYKKYVKKNSSSNASRAALKSI